VGFLDVSGNGNVFFAIGSGNGNSGLYNEAIGYNALTSNNSGTQNAAYGNSALYSNSSGSYNSALGQYALYNNTIGSYNIGIGYQAAYGNGAITNSANIAIGYWAMDGLSSGSNNIAMGQEAMYGFNGPISATDNIAIGTLAMSNDQTGSHNVAVGDYALAFNANPSNGGGSYNTGIGYYAGQGGFFGESFGNYNISVGANAGCGYAGSNNIAMGYQSLFFSTTASNNVAIGYQSMYNTNQSNNTAVGYQALYNSSNSSNNAAFGYQALGGTSVGTSGQYNLALGFQAMSVGGVSNNYNVGVGYQSVYNLTSGSGNTGLGYQTLVNVTSGANNTALGYGADVGNNSNHVAIGNSSVNSTWVQVDWTIGSDARIKNNVQENVPGLAFIKSLRPVTYNYDITKENELKGIKDTTNWPGKYDIEKMKFSGFIAQEVDAAANKIGYDFSGVDKSGAFWGLRYSQFVVPLVKAVQEQQAIIDSSKQVITILQAKITVLENENKLQASKMNAQDNNVAGLKDAQLKDEADIKQLKKLIYSLTQQSNATVK
ncbi:MAG TPA: tail fiber domain-containing protein, partial [Bacteroidia bacterium]|nr:tail fiber domain-containing protein [Bacteroidia bacterium]